MISAGLKTIFRNHRVLITVGSGGVGKTTISAALGIAAAQMGLRVLVLTIDPSKRLASTLGIDTQNGNDQEVKIDLGQVSGRLTAAVLDSQSVFDQFLSSANTSGIDLDKLKTNRLYRELSTTLAGSQEFTALQRLYSSYKSGEFDLVILDTPPTQHARDFLSAPERIRALFQESVTQWFSEPSKPTGLISAILNRSTRVALKALEILTGEEFVESLIDFFRGVRSIQKALRQRTEDVQKLLVAKETGFLLVTSFDRAKIQEGVGLVQDLKARGSQVVACVLNRANVEDIDRLDPKVSGTDSGAIPERLRAAQIELNQIYDSFVQDSLQREKYWQETEEFFDDQILVLKIPEYRIDIAGIESLMALATTLGSMSATKPTR